MIVEVVFLPPLITDPRSKLCIVIDVLRATSTLVSMFGAGARRVILSESIPAALACAEGMAERPLVCGESGGLPPVGFDHGNSPREFRPGALKGRDLLFCTSNGTRAMRLVSEAPVVLTGSLLNGSAVVRSALREARERGLNIALVCSGDMLGTKFAIDDAYCAGYLLGLMRREAGSYPAGVGGQGSRVGDRGLEADDRGPGGVPEVGQTRPAIIEEHGGALDLTFEESAIAATRLYRSYMAGQEGADPPVAPPRESILRAFWESHNAQVLRRVGLAEDVEYCSQLDISDCVPRLRVEEGDLVLLP